MAVFRPKVAVGSVAAVAAQRTQASAVRRLLGLGNLTPRAAAFLAAIVFGAAALSVLGLPRLPLDGGHWGTSLRETGLFWFESLSTDFALAALGVGVSVAWGANPWSIVFVVMPLLLIHRSLQVPQLQEEARIDPKTGLLNAREYGISLDD